MDKENKLSAQRLTRDFHNDRQFLLETPEQRVRKALDRQINLIRTISLVLTLSSIGFALASVGLILVVQWWVVVLLEGLAGLIVMLNGVIYFSIRPGCSLQRVKRASYIQLIGLLISLSLSQFLVRSNMVDAMFILVPILAGINWFSWRETVLISVIAAAVSGVFFSLWKVFNIYRPVLDLSVYPLIELAFWMITFGIIIAGIALFTQRFHKTNRNLEEQTTRLSKLLVTVNATTNFGAALSRDLSGVTTELNATSRQQASGSQEQVAAVTQVTASLEELNETASQIAGSAQSASSFANQAVQIAAEVKSASQLAESTGEQGNSAVGQTIDSVGQVRNRIELLGQRLLALTAQTRKVGTIIDIIEEIADETHLLALNASIEAAGGVVMAGGNRSESRNNRGDRFGVIAQEVKNLSDRSREATEEVRQAITEMQGAMAQAVLVAEEGKKETAAALSRSEIAGLVIDKLNEVISNSATRAEQILAAVEEVKLRCDEISVATGQQRSANQQILVTMRSVAQVSRQSAGAVTQLSETVSRVCEQVNELNVVLDKSSQQAEKVFVVA